MGQRVGLEPSGSSASKWLPGVEALRGFAALAVVVYHVWALSTHAQFPGSRLVAGLGTWGVNLFFVLSGYLLASYFWQDRDRRSLAEYGIRRFARIAPAYYLNVGILFLFFADPALLFSAAGLKQVAANATFTQFLFPSTASSLNVNGSLWTLTIEFLLYLTLPVLALLFARHALLAFLLMVGIGVSWRLYIALDGEWLRVVFFGADSGVPLGTQTWFLSHQFPGLLPVFALGIALRWITQRRLLQRLEAKAGTLSIVLLTLIPSLFWLYFVEPGSDYQHPLMFTFFDYVMALLLLPPLAIAALPRLRADFPLGRVSTWLGDRSYGLYLWHFPIILVVFERGPEMLPAQTSHPAIRIILVLVLSICAAHLSYRLVEVPGIARGRDLVQRLRRRRAVVSGVAAAHPGSN